MVMFNMKRNTLQSFKHLSINLKFYVSQYYEINSYLLRTFDMTSAVKGRVMTHVKSSREVTAKDKNVQNFTFSLKVVQKLRDKKE